MHAQNVVLATATPIHHNLTVHSRQNPYRTFMVALTIPEVITVSPTTLLLSCILPYSTPPRVSPDACMHFAVIRNACTLL